MFDQAHLTVFLWSIVYAVLGIVIFSLAFWLVTVVTPFSVRKEIEEDQNVALGVIIGAFILGIAFIIGSAITG